MSIRIKTSGRVKTTGGQKIRKLLKTQARKQRSLRVPVGAKAGFLNPWFGGMAKRLERGAKRQKLPPRPAFAESRDEVTERTEKLRHKYAHPLSGGTFDVLRKMSDEAAKAIQKSYLDFHGPELSKRQKARKAGTAYQETLLQGRRGPRLIGRIAGRVITRR